MGRSQMRFITRAGNVSSIIIIMGTDIGRHWKCPGTHNLSGYSFTAQECVGHSDRADWKSTLGPYRDFMSSSIVSDISRLPGRRILGPSPRPLVFCSEMRISMFETSVSNLKTNVSSLETDGSMFLDTICHLKPFFFLVRNAHTDFRDSCLDFGDKCLVFGDTIFDVFVHNLLSRHPLNCYSAPCGGHKSLGQCRLQSSAAALSFVLHWQQ